MLWSWVVGEGRGEEGKGKGWDGMGWDGMSGHVGGVLGYG